LPSAASVIASIVVCSVGWAVVCRTQIRAYRTLPTLPRFAVDLTKTWLQYPAAPLIRTDRLPLCAVVVSMVAVPAPEQSGLTTAQSPDGVEPVWFSKPSQSTAPAHPTGGGVVGGGVVGEFGFNHSDGDPDEDTILSYSQANGIGWLGWSWSGNGGGVEYLDMATSFNPASLTTWGERIFNGANGIRQTARQASIYDSMPPPTTPPPTTPPPTTPPPTTPPPTTPPPTTPPPAGGCTAAYAITNQWQGGFQGEVQVTAGTAAITGWTVRWTFANGQSVTQSWNATVTSSGTTVTARNADYNGRLAAGASASFGFIGGWTGTNAKPEVTCTAS